MKLILAAALIAFASVASAATTPNGGAQADLEEGIRLFHTLELEGALKKFDSALGLFPGWKTAAGYRASCRWALGDQSGAKDDAALALKLKPNDAVSFIARGKAKLVLQDFDGARADFRAAIDADPDSVEGPFGEASALSAQGYSREALKRLDEAHRADGRSAAVLLLRGTLKEKLNDAKGAADDFAVIESINPKYNWAAFHRGRALRDLKDYAGADRELSRFLQANPDHEEGNFLRANVRYLTGDYKGAREDLTKVIAVNPRRALAYSNRGLARSVLGDTEGALTDLRKALQLDPARRAQYQAAMESISSRKDSPRRVDDVPETPNRRADRSAGSDDSSMIR